MAVYYLASTKPYGIILSRFYQTLGGIILSRFYETLYMAVYYLTSTKPYMAVYYLILPNLRWHYIISFL